LQPTKLLVFFTGADQIPALGLEREPRITFLEGTGSKILPTASTCVIELRLPTFHSCYDSFKSAMALALKNHGGFGGV